MTKQEITALEQRIIDGYEISFDEAMQLCNMPNKEWLYELANNLRTHFLGNEIETCAVMNARSGRCPQDCKWCAQSAHYKTNIRVYGLVSEEEAVKEAEKFEKSGVTRFSLVTSGRGIENRDLPHLVKAYKQMRAQTGMNLCGSLGLANEEQLQQLRAVGMSRYHCNLETAPSFFPTLCSTHTMDDKMRTIEAAKKTGMDICSGGIIGMGETLEHRIELAMTLRKIGANSIPINVLTPIAGTPLENTPPLSDDELLTAFAIFRVINPKAHLRFAGGRAAIVHIQRKALRAGMSAALVGDLLTTAGPNMKEDFAMFNEMGYKTVAAGSIVVDELSLATA